MSVGTLATVLTVIFVVSVVVLAGELLYVLLRRRSFRRHSTLPPLSGTNDQYPAANYPVTEATAKELLYFFCLKTQTRVEPTGPPNQNQDGFEPDDEPEPVIDVFKLLEANGPSRFLSTIKEEDREDVESTSDVDSAKKPTTKTVCLQACLECDGKSTAGEEVVVTVDGGVEDRAMFPTPCDSPMFFTPIGSPMRDCTESEEFVVSIIQTEKSCGGGR